MGLYIFINPRLDELDGFYGLVLGVRAFSLSYLKVVEIVCTAFRWNLFR